MRAARFEKAVQGDDIFHHVRASTWNMVRESTLRVLENTDAVTGTGRDILRPALGKLTNASGNRQDVKNVMGLNDIAVPVADSDSGEHITTQPFLNAIQPTATERGRFGLLSTESEPDENNVFYGAGIVTCKLFVPTNGAWITRADIDTGDNTRLLATPNGSAQIIWKDAGTNTTVDAIVRLGNPQMVSLTGKTLAQLDPDTSGTIRIWNDQTTDTGYDVPNVWLDWMHGDQPISADKEVLIAWFPHEQNQAGRWRVIGAECEDAAIEFGSLSQSGNNEAFSANQSFQKITTYDLDNGGDSGWQVVQDPSNDRILFTGPGTVQAWFKMRVSHPEDDAEAEAVVFGGPLGSPVQLGTPEPYYIKTKLDSTTITGLTDPVVVSDTTVYELDVRYRKTDGDNETIRIHALTFRIQRLL